MLSTLLNEMDGVGVKSSEQRTENWAGDDQVVVLAATNRVDMIDAAILRPGRIDRMIEVRLPNLAEREDVLRTRHERNAVVRMEYKTFGWRVREPVVRIFRNGAVGQVWKR